MTSRLATGLGCSARRGERRVASHTSEQQRRNVPKSSGLNWEVILCTLLIIILSFVLSNAAHAGGSAVLGKVVSFTGANGNYSFRFAQTAERSQWIISCQEFEVKVNYERVPWFSWLPYVRTHHPTKEMTEVAAAFLLKAHRENREVMFGYMGQGLEETSTPCFLLSRGISLEGNAVLSYYLRV